MTPGIDSVLSQSQALTDNRVIDLNGKLLRIEQNGEWVFSTDAQDGASETALKSFNPTEGGNRTTLTVGATEFDASFAVDVDFNNSDKNAFIAGVVNATHALLQYKADTHTFNGPVIENECPEYADNAEAIGAGLAVGRKYRTGDLLKIVH